MPYFFLLLSLKSIEFVDETKLVTDHRRVHVVVFSVITQCNVTGCRVFISTPVTAYNSNKAVYRRRRLSDTRAYTWCLPSLCGRTNGLGLGTVVLQVPKRLNYKNQSAMRWSAIWPYVVVVNLFFFLLKYNDPIMFRLRLHALCIRMDDHSSI